jgi:hypothetical protein
MHRNILVEITALLLATTCTFGTLLPHGSDIGPVQFDAVIELNPPLACTHMLLFARYWVSTNYYEMSVVWAEPTGTYLRFPIFPMSLAIGSDAKTFELSHDIFSVYKTNFSKPVEASGVFRNMYGDYPVINLRFADKEAFDERIYQSDFTQQALGANDEMVAPVSDAHRKIREITLKQDGNAVKSISLFDGQHILLKSIEYEHGEVGSSSYLRRERILLPERSMIAGLRDNGVTVTVGDEKRSYRDFQCVFEGGGRTALVDYQRIRFTGIDVSLPSYVEVRNSQNKELLRSARFSHFHQTKMVPRRFQWNNRTSERG